MTKKYAMLVKVDGNNNNNKFYEITWNDDDTVTTRYGRNGDQGVTEHKGSGEDIFNKIFKAKTAASKGYKQVGVLHNVPSVTSGMTKTISSLTDIAKRDIANNNPIMDALMERLAKINKYQLLQATGEQIDIVDGVVRTVLGPVTLDAISNARSILIDLNNYISKKDFGNDYNEKLNQLLTYIPQKVPRGRGWNNDFFTIHSSFQKQNDLLDQIEGSIKNYQSPVDDKKDITKDETTRIFSYSMKLLDDQKEFDRIKKYYESTLDRNHSCSHLKLKQVYTLINTDAYKRFEEKKNSLGNVKELFHGSRVYNILSILKTGLRIPRNRNEVTAGSLFGVGLYSAPKSTKALNYSYGYWDTNGKDDNCFLFLLDAALGKEYIPKYCEDGNKTGFDSCHAIAHKSGVINDEYIVYNEDQYCLKYLMEFGK